MGGSAELCKALGERVERVEIHVIIEAEAHTAGTFCFSFLES